MKLPVFAAVKRAVAFCLRRFPTFYLLCILASVPGYAYYLLPCPDRQTGLAATGAQMVLACFTLAIMASALSGDRRREAWTVLSGAGDAFKRLPALMGVSTVFAAVGIGFSLLGSQLAMLHPYAPLAGLLAYFVVLSLFCMTVPCAVVDGAGVFGSFKRSLELSAGSRLRILMSMLLLLVPFLALWAAAMIFRADLHIEHLREIWILLFLPAMNAILLALQAVIHESLSAPGGRVSVDGTATLFD